MNSVTNRLPNTSKRLNKNTTTLNIEALKKHQVCIELFRERVHDFKDEASNKYKGLCPLHPDNGPSLSVYLAEDGETWLYHCFGCDQAGNIFQFVQQYDEVSYQEATQIVREAAENPEYTAKLKPKRPIPIKPAEHITYSLDTFLKCEECLAESEAGKKWLQSRGISYETAKRLRFGYKQDIGDLAKEMPELQDKGWIAFPSIYEDRVVCIKYRSIVEKQFIREPRMRTALFNTATLDAAAKGNVYLVEGEPDAAIMEQAGFHAVSIPSGSSLPDLDKLAGFTVILAGDRDDAGMKAMNKAGEQLEGSRLLKWPQGMKDANQTYLEYCKSDPEKFKTLIHKLTAEAKDAPEVKDFALTDSGNAERFAADHGMDVRYCHTVGKWFVWDGKRWTVDDKERVVQLAKDTARRLQKQALEIDNHQQRQAMIKHGLTSESVSRITAMLTLAQSELPINADHLDQDPMLLNVQNGTIDLRTGQLQEHRRKDFITNLCPIEYDPEAQCPVFMKFLADVTRGDTKLAGYLQRCVGYSLTGDTKEEVLFLLYGTGQNGKSKFLEAVRYVLGTYAQTADFDTFTVDFKSAGAARNDIAKLRGARFVTASESDDGKRLNESIIKQITGGDMIAARFLYGESFEFKPQFKLWLATNHLPAIRGNDEGIWRRIHQVPFTVHIPEHNRDRNLGEKLKAEAHGILRWAVEGLADYRQHGLQEPTVVKQATAEYRQEQDVLGHFLADECVVNPKKAVKASSLYKRYERWANDNGEYYKFNSRQVKQALTERGLKAKRMEFGNIWVGIAFRQPDNEEAF